MNTNLYVSFGISLIHFPEIIIICWLHLSDGVILGI